MVRRIEGMFEGDWSELDAAATLHAAAECDADENHAALGKLHAALRFADLHGELPPRSGLSQARPDKPGRERLQVYGGDGCPAVAEFASGEFAAVLGLSTLSGTALIGEALALRHRFPRLWASTQAGQTRVWRARAVARGCLKLSFEAAAWVDQRITGKIDGLSTTKFYDLLDALIKQADPAAARRAAEDHAKERGVFVNPSDGEGTKTIYVKAATGDVIRFDATISDLAWALAMMGDTDTPDQRRAKAIGWIADPAAAYELLNAARYLATHQHQHHHRRRHRNDTHPPPAPTPTPTPKLTSPPALMPTPLTSTPMPARMSAPLPPRTPGQPRSRYRRGARTRAGRPGCPGQSKDGCSGESPVGGPRAAPARTGARMAAAPRSPGTSGLARLVSRARSGCRARSQGWTMRRIGTRRTPVSAGTSTTSTRSPLETS